MADPYLSLIIRSRNDDHGGNMFRRMEVSINGLLEQLEKYRIESELILVEWNPPPDKPLLKDVLKWPNRLRYCTIRVIMVPPSIHQRYEYADRVAMNAIVACNCGMRRARGQFILLGAIDLLYSDELMSYIASRNLKSDEKYRIDRCIVDRNVVQVDTLKEQLDYCQKNIIRIDTHTPQKHHRWLRWFRDDLPDLYTNAAGDFLLLSREHWHSLRGYPVTDIISGPSERLLSYMAYAAGISEVTLSDSMRLYHIDHDDMWNDRLKRDKLPLESWLSFHFMPVKFNNMIIGLYRKFLRIFGYKVKSSVYGVPVADPAESQRIARDMVAGKRSYVLNDEDWGLGQESLEEFVISTADWDKDYGRNQ